MLTADQIQALRDKAGRLVDPVVEFLIEDIAKRVAEAGQLTSTAAYQVWRAQQLGLSQRKMKKELRKRLKVSHRELRELLTQAAEVGYNFDISRFPFVQAVSFDENGALQQIVKSAVELAQDDLTNITQTIGFVTPTGEAVGLTDAYQQTCDYAFQKVSGGGQDYISAVREAIRNLAEKGIQTIDYESGVHTSLEAAVRRNMMGVLGLMDEKINQQNHDDLGCDGWEISAHHGSAPDHEPIQGKQYPDAEYKRLNGSLHRRIGTLGCGHSAMGIILGVNDPQYTPEELEEMRRENEEGITYEGKHFTLYKATQRQRSIERAMRKQKHRILLDEKLGDKEKLQWDQIRYVRQREEYKRFSDAAGLRMQRERAEVLGFGPKQAKAAEGVSAQMREPNDGKSLKKEAKSISTKKVETFANSGTIDTSKANTTSLDDSVQAGVVRNGGKTDVHSVTRLDIDKYKCVSEDISTDEVIITDERIQHIRERHPNDFERYQQYIARIVETPDYILESDMPNTAFVLKEIQEAGEKFQLILRLKVSTDPEGYKNSVITFLKTSEKKWNKYLRNKKILYKNE